MGGESILENVMKPTASMIAVDWGSTNLRAKLVINGRQEQVLTAEQGIKNVVNGNFEEVLISLCADWKALHPDLNILMSGMIGSREGWVEAPYCLTPTALEDLADQLVSIDTKSLGEVYVVPGLRHDFADETTDVMRGEETEVFGVLAEVKNDVVTVCGPGTHSKWVNCSEGKINSFRTWFTGEAFERLTQNSLISGGDEGGRNLIDNDAFVRGLEHSGRTGGLLHHLFLGRTDMLTKRVKVEHLPSLVSGLLIGHEVREAKNFAAGAIQLIGNNQSAGLYACALDYFELPYSKWEKDVHLAGMLALQDIL